MAGFQISPGLISETEKHFTLRGPTELNIEQRRAVACMLCGSGRVGSSPFILFGPPGDFIYSWCDPPRVS